MIAIEFGLLQGKISLGLGLGLRRESLLSISNHWKICACVFKHVLLKKLPKLLSINPIPKSEGYTVPIIITFLIMTR